MLKNLYYATKQENAKLDELLMGKYGYLSETLMELAGIAVAQSVDQISQEQKGKIKKIGVLVGPGNNGGDALVAGRHLKQMNYDITLYLFKKMENKNGNFLKLCSFLDIPHFLIQEKFPIEKEESKGQFVEEMKEYDLVVDGIFGFPFSGEMKEPYKTFVGLLAEMEDRVFSIDIPSGWDADEGNKSNLFQPPYLISLGLPKKFSETFKGRHFMGGRFIPPQLEKEIGITAPKFQGARLYMEIKD